MILSAIRNLAALSLAHRELGRWPNSYDLYCATDAAILAAKKNYRVTENPDELGYYVTSVAESTRVS